MSTQYPSDQLSTQSAIRTTLSGADLLLNPRLNKGTAFTNEERDLFDLHGMLPPHVGTLENQRERRKIALAAREAPYLKYVMMRDLQDNDETLFYSFIENNIEELLPIVYTPTVGEGCQRFSESWRKPRGLFLSYPEKDRMEQILANPRFDHVRCIVVSDGERILGLGDQGAGGMGISIGKMALYTALGGIPPEHCLPILLDAGTDNETLLNDPIYIGWQHKRVRGAEYATFIEQFIQAVKKRWPNILLQWEDFANPNASTLLSRYRDSLCTFNDDIQGTAAVATGTLLSAVKATGVPLSKQVIATYGAGSAGIGILDLLVAAMMEEGLTEAEARQRIYAIDRYGLLVEGCQGIRPDQEKLVHKRADVTGWKVENPGAISLLDVVRNVGVTVLIGVSAQAGAFSEEIIRTMASHCERPVIFPLSNPTVKAEAEPINLLRWTEGRAIVGTGSPFQPVEFNGKSYPIAQVNNSYVFPGLALGILVAQATRVTDNMIMASAKALASLSPAANDPAAPLLPPITDARQISALIGEVVARQAIKNGVADPISDEALKTAIANYMWEPVYLPYERIRC
ncbi:NAD-dependent malic enzyme [Telmatobacter bradus]|uniref:NAD-dependent malic enzyme n=1 Tax=Telmatobacter bradus TaxID=474953 RepID=UPI003B42BC33